MLNSELQVQREPRLKIRGRAILKMPNILPWHTNVQASVVIDTDTHPADPTHAHRHTTGTLPPLHTKKVVFPVS